MQVTSPAMAHTWRTMDRACFIPLALRGMANRRGTSDQRHQPALGVGVAVDVPLGCLNRSVPGENLHVPERPTGFMNKAGSAGDESPAARVGRTPRQPQVSIRTGEPVGDARWGQAAAAFGTHNVQRSVADLAPPGERFPQIIMKGDPAATPVFCRAIMQFNIRRDLPTWVEDHWPGQVCDFSSAKASLD